MDGPLGALFRTGRVAAQLAWLLRRPLRSNDVYEEDLRDRLAHRERNFLLSAERLIFAHAASPYRPLLDVAGYDLPKLRELVAAAGLDGALDRLRQDGVFLRVTEFKGVEPVVRRERTLHFKEKDFGNPVARELIHARSSGSRSAGSQSGVSPTDLLEHAAQVRWMVTNYGLAERDVVVWSTATLGLQLTIWHALRGRPPRRWFALMERGSPANPIIVRLAAAVSRVPLPRPEVLPAGRVLELARYIQRVNTPRGMIVDAFVSSALRLVLASEEAGIDLGDVAFLVGGEPLTVTKRRQIEGRGFQVFSRFAFTELGRVALACPRGEEADDLHVMTDKVAVRHYPRIVDREGNTVPAYLFTNLLPHARNVMLNVESGDYGALTERSCGCFFEQAGLRTHVHSIRSFEKLTAEGITFIGPSLIALLEEVLPRKFGGDGRHYQLVEGEDAKGFTRLYILASPELGAIDEEALRLTVLSEIGGHHIKPGYGQVVERIWEHASTIQVLRREPLITAAGKVLHLHRERGSLESAADPLISGAGPA